MRKEFTVQGVPVTLECNGALPIVYRNIFGAKRDLLMDVARITNYNSSVIDFSFSEIYDIVFSMAVLAGYKGDQVSWYAKFPQPAEMFGLWTEAVDLLRDNTGTTVKK